MLLLTNDVDDIDVGNSNNDNNISNDRVPDRVTSLPV